MSFQDLEAGDGQASWRPDIVNGKREATQAVASGIFQVNTTSIGNPQDTPELREKLLVAVKQGKAYCGRGLVMIEQGKKSVVV